ncbi:hypothetical protein ALC53_04808 [Atta colombica]|uniref:Uncharacterized protein n=1 Tax=Atta colombica TaxID=520822 RepID=A0A195BK78_9HYME|nr:hypothetical protein ALC53_04808 [Atta colombica]
MTNDSRQCTCARGQPSPGSSSSSVVVIRAGQGYSLREWTIRVYTRARDIYCVCGWTGGAAVGLHTNPLDIPQPSQCDTALPIQHVQPSTCADTINQIN